MMAIVKKTTSLLAALALSLSLGALWQVGVQKNIDWADGLSIQENIDWAGNNGVQENIDWAGSNGVQKNIDWAGAPVDTAAPGDA